ncbi:PASTA domain-containing protein [Paenibacillus eucommiae]|uniref:PASTA domain-containing protein n=1 Tax=Paenibacillus eucommiae TaxID=1355755 RepID=A0ABS4J241_9BACL|nr:PASTA domain-containing protein [Paenibacillus eucommiae]MBP1993906.1 hypothetical protein [Paenibacillus eucommiae]
MESSIGKRYLPEKAMLPLPNGMIYTGVDLSLKRKVFLYTIDSADQAYLTNYLRQLREASRFSGETFMHILDIDLDEKSNRLMVVLKYSKGSFLRREIELQALTFRERVKIIYELSLATQTALKEGIVEFSVGADNLWLDDEKHLVVMNYWEQGSSRERGVTGLNGLLYQLVTGTSSVPDEWGTMETNLRNSLRGNPVQHEQKDSLMWIMQRVMQEDCTLASFTVHLEQLLAFNDQQTGERISSTAMLQRSQMERIRGGFSHEMTRTAISALKEEDSEDELTEHEELQGSGTSPKRRKRVLMIGTASAGFVLATFIIIGILNRDSDPEPAGKITDTTIVKQSPAQETLKPQETVLVTDAEPDPAPAPESSSIPEEGYIQTPNLVGLQREEAEEQALAVGLRYEFKMEENKQGRGVVFRQDPEPKTEIPTGGRVTFWVSKGQ